MSDIHDLSAVDLATLIRTRELSPREAMDATLARIERCDKTLNAVAYLDFEAAISVAESATVAMARGRELGPLGGVPILCKDLDNVQGMPTSRGLAKYASERAVKDDLHIQKLRAAGAIPIGKTNVPPLGCAAWTENRRFGATRNPWNTEKTPGGSSGGSAAAVAGRLVSLATSSDRGGSTRIPGAFTGLPAIKPSRGRIAMSLASLEWTRTASITPLARTVADTALALDVLSGFSAEDPYSIVTVPGCFSTSLEQAPPRLRVGVNRSFGVSSCESDVLSGLDRVAAVLRAAGHEIIDDDATQLPDARHFREQVARRQTINGLSALTSHLVDFENEPEGFDPNYVAPLHAAYTLKPADFYAYWQHREAQDKWAHRLFASFDIYLTPTVPIEAPSIGAHDLDRLHEWIAFTSVFNDTGLPAISIPAGLSAAGLPVGVQIAAPMHQESRLLQLGRLVEQALSWPQCPLSWLEDG